jgi:hypothetical protein
MTRARTDRHVRAGLDARFPAGARSAHGLTLTAPVEIPKGGAEGVIFALGGDAAGWSLFLWEGKARFHYNFFGIRRYDVVSPKALTDRLKLANRLD